MTSTPTRSVDNVVITTKGLQDRNIHILDGTTVKNKGKLIQTISSLAHILKLELHLFQMRFSRTLGITVNHNTAMVPFHTN